MFPVIIPDIRSPLYVPAIGTEPTVCAHILHAQDFNMCFPHKLSSIIVLVSYALNSQAEGKKDGVITTFPQFMAMSTQHSAM